MKNSSYAGVVNSIGLLSLLLGVFLSFTTIKADFDNFEVNKNYLDTQYEEMMSNIDYQLMLESSSTTDQDSISAIDDTLLTDTQSDNNAMLESQKEQLETQFTEIMTELKAQLIDDIFSSAGAQLSLILLGLALIFVAKGLRSTEIRTEE